MSPQPRRLARGSQKARKTIVNNKLAASASATRGPLIAPRVCGAKGDLQGLEGAVFILLTALDAP